MAQVTVRIARNPQRYGICTLQYDRVGVSRLTEVGSTNTRTFGAPDTVRLPIQEGKPNLITLTEPIQKWMHKLCWSRTPSLPEDQAKLSWKSLMSGASEGNNRTARAFSNFSGSGTNADYINGNNLDTEPIKIDFVLCGGAWLKILGEDNRRNIKVEDCWVVEAIDPASDFTRFHPSTHPWLFFYPTVSVRKPYVDKNGTPTGKFIEYISEPFPQYNNLSVMPVFGQRGEPFVYVPKHRMHFSQTPKSPFRASTEPGYTTYQYLNPYR